MNNQMIYDKINARILDSLAEGVAPWRKPWTSKLPVNAVSGKQYRGINLWLLPVDCYSDNRWVTFKQAIDLGGSVSAGQKGSMIVFWTKTTFGSKATDDDDGEAKRNSREVPVLRYYTVFNVEQCHGLKLPAIEAGRDNAPLSTPEQIVAGMPNAPRRETSQVAAYSPARDTVLMPPMASFRSSESFYSVLFHELVHSTGSPKRLGRFDLTEPLAGFGSEDYSREELIAEFGAAFLCGVAGIETTQDNSASYINGWTQAIKDDPRMLIVAAGKAQKAADYILGSPDDNAATE